MSIRELTEQRRGLCLAGGCVEPTVSVDHILDALRDDEIEPLRPLLPVGYDAVARAYARAAQSVTCDDLTEHYTKGATFFQETFVPWVRQHLLDLSGGNWQLDDFVAFAAGSDVDLMTHLVEAVAAREPVHLFPGDWFGFLVGSTHQERIIWKPDARDRLACLCIPSVRNGHVTDEMMGFLESSASCLLNINLFPTLAKSERNAVATRIAPLLPKSVLSISFSRGLGLTASQLGLFLIHKDHPFRKQYQQQWNWFTYFYNAIAMRALMALDLQELQSVDALRREWVTAWLKDHGLPVVSTGSYYVKSFVTEGKVPDHLQPLIREGVLRLCLKPPIVRASDR